MRNHRQFLIQEAINDIDKDITNLKNLLADHKTMAAGDFSRSEIVAEINELQKERVRLQGNL